MPYHTICILVVTVIIALSSVFLNFFWFKKHHHRRLTSSMTSYSSSSPALFTNIQLKDVGGSPKKYNQLVKEPDKQLLKNLNRMYKDGGGTLPAGSNYNQFLDNKFAWDDKKKKFAAQPAPPPYTDLVKKEDDQLIKNLNRMYGTNAPNPGQVPKDSSYSNFFDQNKSKFYWDAQSQSFAKDPDASDKDEVSYPVLALRDDERNVRNLNRMYGGSQNPNGTIPPTSEYKQFLIDNKYKWDATQNKFVYKPA